MILWFIAAFTAYFVKGLCGFANTLVFTTILSFGATNASISPVDLLLGYLANLILTWKNRKSLEAKVWLPLAALVLVGSIPGAKGIVGEASMNYPSSTATIVVDPMTGNVIKATYDLKWTINFDKAGVIIPFTTLDEFVITY